VDMRQRWKQQASGFDGRGVRGGGGGAAGATMLPRVLSNPVTSRLVSRFNWWGNLTPAMRTAYDKLTSVRQKRKTSKFPVRNRTLLGKC
jgi:hypothetical protein